MEDIRYSLSIDESWEEVMNGMDDEFVDSSVDFAKGAKYSELPSILMEGFTFIKNDTVNKKEIDAMARKIIRKYKSTYDMDRFSQVRNTNDPTHNILNVSGADVSFINIVL